MRKHIFSRGNSLGPSTPSSWPSVSRYTSKQTHRREIWLVRSWWPGWGPCSSFLNTFTSLSMALQKEQRKLLVFHHPPAMCGRKPSSLKTVLLWGCHQFVRYAPPSSWGIGRTGERLLGNGDSARQQPGGGLGTNKFEAGSGFFFCFF